jgi:hypothetical protein
MTFLEETIVNGGHSEHHGFDQRMMFGELDVHLNLSQGTVGILFGV